MDLAYKKTLPEDVFVSTYALQSAANNKMGTSQKCPNKLTGIGFIDMFAHLVWKFPRANSKHYAKLMGIKETSLMATVSTLSGMKPSEWRDRFVSLEAQELLRDSEMTIGQIAKRLCFSSTTVFSRYFSKYNKISPLQWRIKVRGFNTERHDIRKFEMQKELDKLKEEMRELIVND